MWSISLSKGRFYFFLPQVLEGEVVRTSKVRIFKGES